MLRVLSRELLMQPERVLICKANWGITGSVSTGTWLACC